MGAQSCHLSVIDARFSSFEPSVYLFASQSICTSALSVQRRCHDCEGDFKAVSSSYSNDPYAFGRGGGKGVSSTMDEDDPNLSRDKEVGRPVPCACSSNTTVVASGVSNSHGSHMASFWGAEWRAVHRTAT